MCAIQIDQKRHFELFQHYGFVACQAKREEFSVAHCVWQREVNLLQQSQRKKTWLSPAEPSTSTPMRHIHGRKVLLRLLLVGYCEQLRPNEDVSLQKTPAVTLNRSKVILLNGNARLVIASKNC